MSDVKPLLIELGTEELPPKALDELSAVFARGICEGLQKHGVAAEVEQARAFCSPRRLAVHVPGVAASQPERAIERRGPAVKAGTDADGKPTRALTGFAGSCGVDVEQLQTLETDKGSWYVHRAVEPGQPTAALLPGILADALKALPIPRPMRWGDHDYRFVRPVHWLVLLHGADVVPAELMGLSSSRQSHGHRFHHPEAITIEHADQWLDTLRDAHVLADPAERRQRIRDEVAEATVSGAPHLSDDLLDELANLVEWPAAVACTFERDFLRVPQEALVTTMETNQKFVPVYADDGALSEHFIGIANIVSKDPEQIRKGYERVIRPRFADARFFYDEDLKTPLAELQTELVNVTYQESLGNLWDKTCRVAELARVIANRVDVDAGQATAAASLSKCDLLTRMVGEFPELQGVMGRYYARAQGEPDAVADALDEAYMPRHAGDRIAEGGVARVLAVAERLDTLAGIFAVGLKPSGNKDPFALRRAALGLARTLVEGNLTIDLGATFREALELIPEPALSAGLARGSKRKGKDDKPPAFNPAARRAELLGELTTFVRERLRGYYAEQGFSRGQFDAVAAVDPFTLPDFDRRLRAVAAFAELPEAASLAAANKRVGNILRKQAEAGVKPASTVDASLFEEAAEKALADALAMARDESDTAMQSGDYHVVLTRLASLQAPVDAFFDAVLVAADDPACRANRLALLADLQANFMAVADIARL
ncbi:MAG TPA: glycine--tRNA ligase subunit beta [Oleiagrimonas sp.]|nr:glycine--tRNA ligase subunit beta [Oleiagrimonas sp.]